VLKNTGETDRRLSKEELMRRLQHDLQKAQTAEVRKLALNGFKDREMFRIDIRHLLHHELPFGAFSSELTELAEVVMSAGLDLAQQGLKDIYAWPDHTDKTPCTVALFGLGKFGGREMGYASDIELLCVYRSDATLDGPTSLAVSEYAEMLVRQLFDLIKARQAGIFEIDLRLRPFGSHGSLATSVESFCQYYRQNGRAALFERQALIKLRWVAGDPDLGQEIERYRDRFVYSGQPFDIDAAVQLRQRQIDELVRFGSTDTKYSRGGLIDVEYLVQYLQLLHGAGRPELHTTNTLEAMEALHQLKLLAPDEFQRLRAAYIFVRHLIDALRIVRGHARDLVLPPTDSDEFVFLARRMDYWDHRRATEKFAADLTAHMRHAAHIYHDRFISSVRRVRSMR
jgi:glutamate-ammonia-ligase adenylyltransferase